jgi:hypothetical protein
LRNPQESRRNHLKSEPTGRPRLTKSKSPLSLMEEAPHLFEFAGWISRVLPAVADRELLSRRILAKVSGARRGRLYLPANFPSEVRRLSKLTTGQLRETVYWFKASTGVRNRTNRSAANYIHQVMPGGCIRTVNGDISVHERQSELVKPLPTSDWPRLGTRSCWPSSPSFAEMMAMGRRGITPLPFEPSHDRASRCVTLACFNSNAELRARIISQQIVGIRSDIEVPKKYLGYFRYRQNFLILTGSYRMPIGLVRFLTGQWIRNPHNLWLRRKLTFKKFLKVSEVTGFTCVPPGPW